MEQSLLPFFILAGAAALGFLFAWSIFIRKQAVYEKEKKAFDTQLKESQAASSRLSDEIETQQLSLDNLQKLLHTIEGQTFELEKEVEMLRAENNRLSSEIESQGVQQGEVREIEVIREVPVLVFREHKIDETKKEKAAKLVRAFKKGFTENNKKAVPPPSS